MPDPKFDMPDTSNSFEARGGWLVKRFMIDFDLTLEQAAGIIGNLGFESGGFKILQELRPSIFGSRGGYGWAQWTGPRRKNFEKWCLDNNLNPSSDEANFGYLEFELKGDYKNTIVLVKKFKSLSDCVFSVGQTYERPGGTTATHLPGFESRLAYAQRALNGVKFEILPEPQQEDVNQGVLQFGSRGDGVKRLQGLLKITQDGEFGNQTKLAVMRFQSLNNLISDGVVGPKTWEKLNEKEGE